MAKKKTIKKEVAAEKKAAPKKTAPKKAVLETAPTKTPAPKKDSFKVNCENICKDKKLDLSQKLKKLEKVGGGKGDKKIVLDSCLKIISHTGKDSKYIQKLKAKQIKESKGYELLRYCIKYFSILPFIK